MWRCCQANTADILQKVVEGLNLCIFKSATKDQHLWDDAWPREMWPLRKTRVQRKKHFDARSNWLQNKIQTNSIIPPKSKGTVPTERLPCTLGYITRKTSIIILRNVYEPISQNHHQYCFKILWSFNLCPSGAIHRWPMVAYIYIYTHILFNVMIYHSLRTFC